MIKKISVLFLMAAIVFVSTGIPVARAASLTDIILFLNRVKTGTLANYEVDFTTPTGIASGATVILTFDNSTSIPAALDFTDMDLQVNGSDVTLAAAPSGSTWGAVRTSSTVITFTNGTTAVTAGQPISVLIGTNATFGTTGDQQITNGSVGTTTVIISGTFGDTGTGAVPIIPDDTVNINAVVQPSISFTISDNTLYFGNLRTAGPCFAQGTDPGNVTCPTTSEAEAFNLTAGTNATGGYTINLDGDTLTSAASDTITAIGGTPAASAPGTEQFGVRYTATGGSGTVSSPYDTSDFALITGVPNPIASAPGPSATTTYSARYIANIAPDTEAGIYTAAHVYTAYGTF